MSSPHSNAHEDDDTFTFDILTPTLSLKGEGVRWTGVSTHSF